MNTGGVFTSSHTGGLFNNAQAKRLRRAAIVLVCAASLFANQLAFAALDTNELWHLVQTGRGDEALAQLAAEALTTGGWGPAPGDTIVYDRFMPHNIRGAVEDRDEAPFDFNDPAFCVDAPSCESNYRLRERQVRFGQALFGNLAEDGFAPRPTVDDIMATYIEEVGHSWQEYLYETEGRGQGARTRLTTVVEAQHWAPGREYQVKRYLLHLDGIMLALSTRERAVLLGQICSGYANPAGHEVPAHGPPAGWPHPEGWPTANPTTAELSSLCAGR